VLCLFDNQIDDDDDDDDAKLCVRSNRFPAEAGAVAEPHLRGSSQSEAGVVRVRPTARRQRVARQADTASQPRSTAHQCRR